jgi:ribosome maturation factor RimP
VLQVRVDRPDAVPGRGITVEECAVVNRSLQPWLDQTQALGPRYVLEVSSPGIERPVRWLEHWERFTGQDVNVRLPGQGRVRGTIVRVLRETGQVVLRPAGSEEEMTVPLDQARDATLAVDWSAIDWSATGQKE